MSPIGTPSPKNKIIKSHAIRSGSGGVRPQSNRFEIIRISAEIIRSDKMPLTIFMIIIQ